MPKLSPPKADVRGQQAQHIAVTDHYELGVPCEQPFRQTEVSRTDDVETVPLPPSVIRTQFEALLRRHHMELLAQLERCLRADDDNGTTGTSAGLGPEDVVLSGIADLQISRSLCQPAQPVRDTLDAKQSQVVAAEPRLDGRPDQHVVERAASENEAEANKAASSPATGNASTEGVGVSARRGGDLCAWQLQVSLATLSWIMHQPTSRK